MQRRTVKITMTSRNTYSGLRSPVTTGAALARDLLRRPLVDNSQRGVSRPSQPALWFFASLVAPDLAVDRLTGLHY